MRSSPRIALAGALALAVLVVATCGPGSIWTGPGDSGDGDGDADADSDADTDTDSDTDSDFDSDSDADADAEAEADAADGGDGSIMGLLADALDAANADLCECFSVESGYESVAACIEDATVSPLVRECLVRAYMIDAAAVAPYYECRLAAETAYAGCVAAAGCVGEAIDACDATRLDELAACPTTTEEVAAAFDTELATCSTGPPSGCPDMTPVAGTIRFASTTEGQGDDLSASCGGSQGADVAYRWTTPSAGTFVFDTEGSEFDTVLYVTTGCEGGVELGCNDDIDTAAGNRASRVAVELASGQIILIVVDGWGLGDFGDYMLNIEFP